MEHDASHLICEQRTAHCVCVLVAFVGVLSAFSISRRGTLRNMRRRTAECLLHLAGTVLLIACLTRAQQRPEGNAAIRFAAAEKDQSLPIAVSFSSTRRYPRARIRETAALCLSARQFFLGDACQLSEEIVQKTLDVATRAWHVDDAFFAHHDHDHDLQNVVDCASDGDAILLNTSRTVQPRSRVEISKRLEIRAFGETDTLTKANLTCPPNDSLFFIRSVVYCSRRCRLRSLPSTGMSMSC